MFRRMMMMTAVLLVALSASTALAQHGGDVVVGRSSGGQLKIEADLDEFFLLPPSPPDGWVGDEPGFDHLPSDETGEDFYTLASGASIQFVLVSKDAGLRILQQQGLNLVEVLANPGNSATLGGNTLHMHLTWWIDDDIVGADFEGVRSATFYLHDAGTTGYADSDPFTIRFTNTTAVPEPLTLWMLATGGLAAIGLRRRRRAA